MTLPGDVTVMRSVSGRVLAAFLYAAQIDRDSWIVVGADEEVSIMNGADGPSHREEEIEWKTR